MGISVIDVETIAFDQSFDLSKVGQLALCVTPSDLEELAGILDGAGDKKFLPEINKWLNSPYRNYRKEN